MVIEIDGVGFSRISDGLLTSKEKVKKCLWKGNKHLIPAILYLGTGKQSLSLEVNLWVFKS